MDRIAIVGTSGHARVVVDAVLRQARYIIAGFLDKTAPNPTQLGAFAFLGSEEQLATLRVEHDIAAVVVATGDNALRARIVAHIESVAPDMRFATVVHPSAVVAAGVRVGDGTVVLAGAVVNAGSSIGSHCILNTRCSLDHDGVLGDFASLGPGVTVGGNCHISAHSAIGIGATIKHGVTIGEHVVIGASSLVLKSLEPNVVAYGSPARVIRSRQLGDRYL